MHKYSNRFIKKNDKRDLAIFNKLLKQTNKSHRVNQYHSYLYIFSIYYIILFMRIVLHFRIHRHVKVCTSKWKQMSNVIILRKWNEQVSCVHVCDINQLRERHGNIYLYEYNSWT